MTRIYQPLSLADNLSGDLSWVYSEREDGWLRGIQPRPRTWSLGLLSFMMEAVENKSSLDSLETRQFSPS